MSDTLGTLQAIATRTIQRQSPVTGEDASQENAVQVAFCKKIAGRAAAAFPEWSQKSALERANLLRAASGEILARKSEFIATLIDEIGAPLGWAEHNVDFAAVMLREVASYADEVNLTENVQDAEIAFSTAIRVPCGVCLGIAPWNAPIILGVRAVAAPLLCGNTVILKGNELAPQTFRMIGEAFQAAGIPDNVLQVVLTVAEDSEAAVEALIQSPVIRRVNFTGSTRVGIRVAELCAKHLKRPLLELGGQANQIVLEDADLDAAAQAAVLGAYTNQGQICMSTERLIVVDEVANELVKKIEQLRSALTVGDPRENSDIGPVISVAAAERLSHLINDAVNKGAQLVGGGTMRGAYVDPTLIDGVEANMRIYHEEVFGPLLSVTRVSDETEAITIANDSEYGLSAAVWSKDEARALFVARQLHSGICHVNRATVGDNPHAPFGGVKSSGYGRFGGRWAVQEFTELRWITSPSEPPPKGKLS